MKLLVNLIPEKRKRDVRRRKTFRFVVWQEILFVFALLVFLSILFSVNFILKMELSNTQKIGSDYMNRSEFAEVKKYEEGFGDINNEISLVRSIQKNDFYWTNFFYELSSMTPEGVVVDSLSTSKTKVVLDGKSKTRDNLIVFKDKLEQSSCFHSVNVPLSDIVIKEDIDFEMTLFINKDCLKLKEDE
ncbi:PilN domain-containing protein [Patescibacteria group bacterium]